MTIQEFVHMSKFNNDTIFHIINFTSKTSKYYCSLAPIEVKTNTLHAELFYKKGIIEPDSKILGFTFFDDRVVIEVEAKDIDKF